MTAPRSFSWQRRGRIPALDGIRAVAIALVLVAHALGTGILPMNARLAGFAGDLGVRSFFVLSGFLITTLLLREHDQRGTISLWSFYVRRVFRIFPAFYTYLIVLAALALLGLVELRDNDLLAAASYTTNFHADRSWWTRHLWSLAVEEQFYVIWPLALIALGLARASWFAVAAVIGAPAVRLALWHLAPAHRDLVDQAFPCVFDALATGCLLAVAAPQLVRSPRCTRLLDSRWFWPAAAVALAPMLVGNPHVRYGLAMSAANLAIAAVLLRCVARPHGRVTRVLERPALVWIGTLSYSLYLWQQLFIDRHAPQWIHQFPVNVIGAFVAAIACHYLVERPCLRMNPLRAQPARPAHELTALGRPDAILDVSAHQAELRRAAHPTATGTRATSHADT